MTPQSMNEVIAAIEGKGFVRRTAHPTHGRILRTELTSEGVAALEACDEVVDAIEEEMLHALSTSDRERLAGFLASCVRMLGAGAHEH